MSRSMRVGMLALVLGASVAGAQESCRAHCDEWYASCRGACDSAPVPAECKTNCETAHNDCLSTCNGGSSCRGVDAPRVVLASDADRDG